MKIVCIASGPRDEALRDSRDLISQWEDMFSKKADRETFDGVWQVTRRATRSVATGGPGFAWLTATGAEPLIPLRYREGNVPNHMSAELLIYARSPQETIILEVSIPLLLSHDRT